MCVARMTARWLAKSDQMVASLLHTDIGHGGRDADLDARVTLLSQLALEELVQFGVKDTIGNELSALGDSTLCGSHDE